jgi:hypothetical protein
MSESAGVKKAEGSTSTRSVTRQKAKGSSCGGGNKAPPIASHLRQRFWWGTQDQEIPFGRQKADGNWYKIIHKSPLPSAFCLSC